MTVDVVDVLLGVVLFAYAHGGWLLYFSERSRYTDLATDVAQLIHDRDLGLEDLRRARDHDAVDNAVRRDEC